MVHQLARKLLLHPEEAYNGLHDLLQDNGADDLRAGDKVAGLDLGGFVDAVLVEPFPLGDVEDVEEDRGNPVCNDRHRKSEEVVRQPVDQVCSRAVVDWPGC